MKRQISTFLIILALCGMLSACGPKQITVPDAVLDAQIPLIIQNDYELNSLYSSSLTEKTEWAITHTPDEKAKLDEVRIEFTFFRNAGTIKYDVIQVYQYMKNSDSWDVLRTDVAEYKGVDIDEAALIGAEEYGSYTFRYYSYVFGAATGEYEWTVTTESIDTDSQSATIDYDITYTEGTDELSWNSSDAFWGSEDTDLDFTSYYENEGQVYDYDFNSYGKFIIEIPCEFSMSNEDNYSEEWHNYLAVIIGVDGIQTIMGRRI